MNQTLSLIIFIIMK